MAEQVVPLKWDKFRGLNLFDNAFLLPPDETDAEDGMMQDGEGIIKRPGLNYLSGSTPLGTYLEIIEAARMSLGGTGIGATDPTAWRNTRDAIVALVGTSVGDEDQYVSLFGYSFADMAWEAISAELVWQLWKYQWPTIRVGSRTSAIIAGITGGVASNLYKIKPFGSNSDWFVGVQISPAVRSQAYAEAHREYVYLAGDYIKPVTISGTSAIWYTDQASRVRESAYNNPDVYSNEFTIAPRGRMTGITGLRSDGKLLYIFQANDVGWFDRAELRREAMNIGVGVIGDRSAVPCPIGLVAFTRSNPHLGTNNLLQRHRMHNIILLSGNSYKFIGDKVKALFPSGEFMKEQCAGDYWPEKDALLEAYPSTNETYWTVDAEKNILVLDMRTQSWRRWTMPAGLGIVRLIAVDSKMLVVTKKKGLYWLDDMMPRDVIGGVASDIPCYRESAWFTLGVVSQAPMYAYVWGSQYAGGNATFSYKRAEDSAFTAAGTFALAKRGTRINLDTSMNRSRYYKIRIDLAADSIKGRIIKAQLGTVPVEPGE